MAGVRTALHSTHARREDDAVGIWARASARSAGVRAADIVMLLQCSESDRLLRKFKLEGEAGSIPSPHFSHVPLSVADRVLCASIICLCSLRLVFTTLHLDSVSSRTMAGTGKRTVLKTLRRLPPDPGKESRGEKQAAALTTPSAPPPSPFDIPRMALSPSPAAPKLPPRKITKPAPKTASPPPAEKTWAQHVEDTPAGKVLTGAMDSVAGALGGVGWVKYA